MKKLIKQSILLCFISFAIFSCSSDQESSGSSDVVKDAASLMNKMNLSGAEVKNGDIPVPSGVLEDNIGSMPSSVIVTSNSLFTIPIDVNTTDGRKPRIVFIKLDGSDKYYQIDLDINGNPSNRAPQVGERVRLSCSGQPDIRLEANGLNQTSYENNAQVYTYSPPLQSQQPAIDFSNRQYWSVGYQITFKVYEVGSGDVQVSLTWDTVSDIDLWLTEPNGNKIYYANNSSDTGGELDFDNTYAYGPENIFYKNEAPSGTYKIEVDYFSGSPETHYNIVVKNGSVFTTYEGVLYPNQTNTVVTFQK
jgi:hypothetical protein